MLSEFNPNRAASIDSGIFGLPFSEINSKIILIPVPWEATTSYGGGTSNAPQAILQASRQIDLFDSDLGNFYETGITMLDESDALKEWNIDAKRAAQIVINETDLSEDAREAHIRLVNTLSEKLNYYIYEKTIVYLEQNKIVGIVGGDHSTPFGAICAHLEKYPDMGILHIDAHADLRQSFEGFEYSHASIMHNVMTKTGLSKLVQVGIRDYCEEEYHFIQQNLGRITAYFDSDVSEAKMSGKNWYDLSREIVTQLPDKVYVSFDIDGLDPQFCPHTGTPVPGGLSYHEALLLLKILGNSGRQIIGFDINEVSIGSTALHDIKQPADEWDANVGARLLYKLCGWAAASETRPQR